MGNVEHIAILGMTGTGKTYFIKNHLLKPAKQKGIPVIILDLERDYNGFVVKNYKNIKNYIGKKSVIKINTDDYDEEQMQSDIYNHIFKKIRDAMVVIDEVHNQGGHQHKLDMNLKKLITRGRKRGLKIVLASQRPALVDKTLLSNCGTLILKKVGWGTDWNIYKEINKDAYNQLKESTNKYATVILRQGVIWKRIL